MDKQQRTIQSEIVLGELATVQSGLILSRKESKVSGGTELRYSLINLKSFHEDATIARDALDVFDTKEPLDPKYLTQTGDIVIRLSSPYTAVLITDETTGLVISSYFAVVKVEKKDRLLPEYLYWLLNSRFVKSDILQHNSRNMLGAIRPLYYKELKILLPPMTVQKEIGTLHLLTCREIQLLRKLADQKTEYYERALENQYNECKKENER